MSDTPPGARPATGLPAAVPPWHIVLVGLPGVGKTSVGRRLAKELERPFADVDEQLELAAGRSIRRLFREEGEEAFRALETQVLGDLLAHPAPLVLAAGGGVVTRRENRALLHGEGDGAAAWPDRRPTCVVWLRASAAFLAERTDATHRPLLAADPVGALTRLEAERADLYAEVADLEVDVEPFRAPDAELPAGVKPKHAIARHIIERLTPPATGPGGDDEGAAQPAVGRS